MLTTTELRNVARRSGARDIGNVEIDVLLTHILQLFNERGVLDHLAFKGGTMLRKMVFGPRGRLSTDLDFTKSSDIDGDDLLLEIAAILHDAPYHDITFLLERDKDWYRIADGLSANPLFVSTVTLQRLFGMISRSWYRRGRIVSIDNIVLSGPLFGGDTLYAQSCVMGLEDGGDADAGHVLLEITGTNARGEKVAQATCTIKVYRRGRHPEDRSDDTIAEQERFSLYHNGPDGALVEQTGLWFDDLRENETFIHWPGRTITAEEGRLSALRSLEINPRWHDHAFQDRYPGLEQGVSEPLLIGVVTALTTRSMGRVVANLGWKNAKFPNPVRYGQSIYAESTILELRSTRSRPSQGLARVETRAVDENGAPVCSYERALLIYRRGEGPFAASGY